MSTARQRTALPHSSWCGCCRCRVVRKRHWRELTRRLRGAQLSLRSSGEDFPRLESEIAAALKQLETNR